MLFFLMLFASATVFALNIKGVEYMSIPELSRICGMRYKTYEKAKRQVVFSKNSRMDFRVNSREMFLNGNSVWLGYPIVVNSGRLYIAKRDYTKTIAPILFPQKNGTPHKLFHIILDAGHGGKDNGAQNLKLRLREKNITLDIVLRVGKILKANGYRVSYTRTKDNFVELPDRSNYANKKAADMFLSIHCNAATANVKGIETFAMTPAWTASTGQTAVTALAKEKHLGNKNDAWNQMLAFYIQRSLKIATASEDRGVKRARFAVLRGVNMPAALIEVGFISNNQEASQLGSAKYRQKIANAIANAVLNYHSTLRRLAKK